MNYPMIALLLRWKQTIPGAGTAVVFLGGLWLGLRSGYLDFAVAGLVLAAVAYVALSAALEVIGVIAETLLPR